MKKSALLFFVLISTAFSAKAQLQKGDLEISLSTSYSNSDNADFFSNGKSSTFRSSFSLGEMINERVMLGAGVSVFSTSSYAYSSLGNYKVSSYYLSPFWRYYFLKKGKLFGFGFINSTIGHIKSEYGQLPIINNKGWLLHAQGGFGAQYFFAPNLAVHAEIGTFIFENKYASNINNLLFTNIGIRTLINDRVGWEGNLKDRYLKKGNYVLSGNINLTSNDILKTGVNTIGGIKAKAMQTNLSFNPEVKYFVKDNFAVFADPGFSANWNGSTNIFDYSLGIGVEAYLAISDFVYFVPSLDVDFHKSKIKYYTTDLIVTPSGGVFVDTIQAKEINIQNTGTAEVAIKYFGNDRTILSAGVFYNLKNYVNKQQDYSIATSGWGVSAEMEYFFAKNISLNFRATYIRGETNLDYGGNYPFIDVLKNKNISIGSSINYFIFR